MTKVNYTEELTTQIVNDYAEGEGKTVEQIAEEIGKSVNSVRSKLVKEGVYTAPEKPVAAKKIEGPSKKELLNELEAFGVIKVDGLMGATKAGISAILEYVQMVEASDEQPEDEQAETENAA